MPVVRKGFIKAFQTMTQKNGQSPRWIAYLIIYFDTQPKGDLDSADGNQVDSSGNRIIRTVTTRSEMKKIIAPRRTV